MDDYQFEFTDLFERTGPFGNKAQWQSHHAAQTKASQENSHKMQLQTFYLELSIMAMLFFFSLMMDGLKFLDSAILKHWKTFDTEPEPGQFRVASYSNGVIYRHISIKTFLCRSRTLPFRSQTQHMEGLCFVLNACLSPHSDPNTFYMCTD